MIYIGTAGIPSITEGDTLQGIQDVKKIGLDAMELEFVRNVYLKKDSAIEVGKIAKNLGIKLSIHASYFVNLCNPEKVEDSKKRILSSCEIGHYARAKYIVFHPGYYGKLSKEEAYEFVKKGCEELMEEINKNKWDVFLGLETTGKKSQFGTLDEILKICDEVKGCRPVIDFAHIFARQGGEINYSEVLEKVKKFKEIHTHFSGIEFTDKGEKRHLAISTNQPDFKELGKELLNKDFGGKDKNIIIICESPLIEQDSLRMKKIIGDLEK
ncbi:MAG: TIM barrel protein [Candidatus Aenigmarchaeota archaeon]|nr:TIM barrel protein [Candidatus Aenigmarchaeota archaeon]